MNSKQGVLNCELGPAPLKAGREFAKIVKRFYLVTDRVVDVLSVAPLLSVTIRVTE